MLKQRLITASVMLTVFLCSLFLLPILGFSVFVSAVILVGAWEWANISGFEKPVARIIYCIIIACVMLLLGGYIHVYNLAQIDTVLIRNILLGSATWWAVALLWVQGYPTSAALWGNRWVRAIMGGLVLLPSWLALIYLYQLNHGSWMILLLVSIVIAADTGAYFFGRAFGKRKLAAQVSPGKSWEGFWGGILCCLLLALGLAWFVNFDDWLLIVAVVIPTALVSVLGDLFESMMKRHQGIKDSGVILPGHGGVLDRVDSLTAAAPIFVLSVLLTGWTL